uniref:FAD-binding PCMH-type domain-containing protein n=1 Tax=Skeletonema marinoi TaxID=267567 RepID=A0A7S2P4K6_9STRA|mmetsp:Transcript_13743/g.23060  ORF Transcript_13743/g.23060 Transcript_13743/m.23060 type:complete len:791 (+) Transcript_13743:64-2436(+)
MKILLPLMAMACATSSSSVTATSDSDKSVEHVVHMLKDILRTQNSLKSSIALPHEGNGYTARLGEMEDGGIISASVAVGGSGGLRRGLKDSSPSCSLGIATHFGWSNWFETIATLDTPVFRVKSDSELKTIVKKSAKKGCRVRPMGTTHSADGLIIQRTDEDVVVVSLADYTTTREDWADGIDTETGLARFRAGMLFYEAVAISRPHGFVFRERSAIPLFTIGGVVANMVHGGSKSGGFVHSDVTKLLVMKSNGKVVEVEGDELQFWRSSAGQLGIILAAEFQLVSEENGGLVMSRENTGPYLAPGTTPSPSDIQQLVVTVTTAIFGTIAAKDHCQFFYDWYANTLNAYTSDFSGEPFDGEEPLHSQYQAAADGYLAEYGGNNADFTGGLQSRLPVDDLCLLICEEGTGPLFPTGLPCVEIESTLVPGTLLCEVPVEVGAVFSQFAVETLNAQFDGRKSTVNDGFVVDSSLVVKTAIVFFPSRALPQVFGAWWAANAQVVGWASGQLPNPPFQFAPTGPLEMRFINPAETAVMNPIPTFEEWKEEFDSDVGVPGAFDLFFPPSPGIPDGLFAYEVVVLDGINDGDANKYLAFMEGVFKNVPTNPQAPYGPNAVDPSTNIVQKCDVSSNVFPCAPISGGGFAGVPGFDCCNPPIPVRNVHLGKGWGYGVDPETTPITFDPVPFQDQDTISSLFSSGSKASSVDDFNDKVDELDADVFAGGALLRWLRPDSGKGGFEPRKLVGQECGSTSYATDPDAECISGDCDEDNSICVKVSAPSSKASKEKNVFGDNN